MKKDNREREIITLTEEFEDQTGYGPWKYEGQTYDKIDDDLDPNSDGETHKIVVKRQSDGKFFQFRWTYYHSMGDYEYDTKMTEVFPKITIKYE